MIVAAAVVRIEPVHRVPEVGYDRVVDLIAQTEEARADGITRRELPVPFRPGRLGASIDGFAIRYLRAGDGVEFLRVQRVAVL
jgi:hypothetical protein